MKRFPHQPPQTSMERHVEELVAHLREGTDSRAGFAKAVERAQDHAFWLEKTCQELRAENENLYRSRLPGMPSFSASSETLDLCMPYHDQGPMAFDWNMKALHYRALWNGYDLKDRDVAKRTKLKAFRELLRLFRAEFERTWTLNMGKL